MKLFNLGSCELALRIPLGLTRKPYYYMQYLQHGTGWQWRYLLVTLDRRGWKGVYRWRWQRQVQQSFTRFTKRTDA